MGRGIDILKRDNYGHSQGYNPLSEDESIQTEQEVVPREPLGKVIRDSEIHNSQYKIEIMDLSSARNYFQKFGVSGGTAVAPEVLIEIAFFRLCASSCKCFKLLRPFQTLSISWTHLSDRSGCKTKYERIARQHAAWQFASILSWTHFCRFSVSRVRSLHSNCATTQSSGSETGFMQCGAVKAIGL